MFLVNVTRRYIITRLYKYLESYLCKKTGYVQWWCNDTHYLLIRNSG